MYRANPRQQSNGNRIDVILHADRSTFFHKVVKDILSQKGITCRSVTSKTEAVTVLNAENVDMIITGLELEDGGADELIDEINRSEHRSIPVLVITGNDSIELREQYFSLGVVDYLLKKDVSYDLFDKYFDTLFFHSQLSERLRNLSLGVLDDSTLSIAVIKKIFEMNGVLNADYYASPEDFLGSDKMYDLLLVDVVLPGMSGEELILRYRQKNKNCVIIAISAIDNIKTVTNILSAGADDYLIKPFDAALFMARIRAGARISMLLEELDAKTKELERISDLDGLTEITDQRGIQSLLEEEIKRSRRGEESLSIILADIDRFKELNKVHGRNTGDSILRLVAETFTGLIGDRDTVGRYGGEEFLFVLPGTEKAGALDLAETIRKRIEESEFKPFGTRITVSFGVAELEGESAGDLLEKAESNLSRGKELGRNRVVG
jgi:diguanylate cyclase (GGDEF)-like protein